MEKINRYLFKPIDNSFLVIFRVCFGFLITAEAWGAILTGWVRRAFIEPQFTFPFIDFSFLQPLPGDGMYYYFFIMGCFGLAVMAGFKYRWAIGGYTLLWTTVYLMQKTNYNNHYYLLVLQCLMMWILPAHRAFSFDAKYSPSLRTHVCPNWCRLWFLAQIGIVYTYAGIAKLNPDWLTTDAIATILQAKKDFWLVGNLLQQEWMHWFIAVGGTAFDLFIAPLLLWKPTRKWAFFASIFFHLFNSAIFHVGIFPYMGIAMCIFFFPPESVQKFFFKSRQPIEEVQTPKANRWLVAGLGIWLLVQLVLPSRHWFFNSDVHWTEEGHRLSWRMMLRTKSGYVQFTVVDKTTGETEVVNNKSYLTYKQERAVAARPDMCWQFVQKLKEAYAEKGMTDIAIYANGQVSINGKPYRPLYNAEVDLARVDWDRCKEANWLMPYE